MFLSAGLLPRRPDNNAMFDEEGEEFQRSSLTKGLMMMMNVCNQLPAR